TLQASWFAANPNFHPVPAGYGLPWGTAGEKDIPGPLVFQAELALAKEQLKTQTPPYQKLPLSPPTSDAPSGVTAPGSPPGAAEQPLQGVAAGSKHDVRTVSNEASDSSL